MNSKKIVAIVAISVFAIVAAKAQPQIYYYNNAFRVLTPAIKDQSFDENKTPFSKIFLETGSGAFFILPTNGNQQQTIPSPPQKWYYKSNGNKSSFAQTAFFYDTIRRPPHASLKNIYSTITNGQNPEQNLTDTNQIKVINAVGKTILPNDTMTIAISYKNNPPEFVGEFVDYNKSVVAFFYNSSENIKLFQQIPTGADVFYTVSGGQIKPIRVHNGENLISLEDSELPASIVASLYQEKQGYENAVYFSFPYAGDGKEKNIFISLVPSLSEDIIEENGGSYKAMLIDYGGASEPKVRIFELPLITNGISHDPNTITSTPYCLGDSNTAANKKIDYEIEFENDGTGEAEKIIIEVSIPLGMQFPLEGINDLKVGIYNLSCQIGLTNVNVIPNNYTVTSAADIKNLGSRNLRKCFYELKRSERKIKFTINNAKLSYKSGPFGLTNIGKIKFSLFTNLSAAYIPECMYSTVSIKFDDNKPIVPKPCFIKRDCKRGENCTIEKSTLNKL